MRRGGCGRRGVPRCAASSTKRSMERATRAERTAPTRSCPPGWSRSSARSSLAPWSHAAISIRLNMFPSGSRKDATRFPSPRSRMGRSSGAPASRMGCRGWPDRNARVWRDRVSRTGQRRLTRRSWRNSLVAVSLQRASASFRRIERFGQSRRGCAPRRWRLLSSGSWRLATARPRRPPALRPKAPIGREMP